MLLSSVLYINLIAMIISDLRKRLINVYVFVSFAFLIIYSVYNHEGIYTLATRMELNMYFLVFMFLCLGLYIRLTKRRIFDCIGLGDILFIVALAPLFELRQFIVFLIVTFVFTSFVSAILSKFLKFENIPLVACMGIGLIIHDIINKILV